MAGRNQIGLATFSKKSKVRRKGRHNKVTPKREKKGLFRQSQPKKQKKKGRRG